MCMKPRKYYYAVVWESDLRKKSFLVKGELVTKKTKLPRDPRLLYGTSSKDISKVAIPEYKNIITYNMFTGEQRVRFERKSEEYILKRDVRIVIWEDCEEIDLGLKYHRVVSPDFLESLSVESTYEGETNMIDISELSNPEKRLKSSVYKLIEGFA